MGEFSERQDRDLLTVATVTGVTSILASLLIIYSFLRFKELRKFSFELVVYLALSDVLSNFTYFFGFPENNDALCDFQGMGMQFFELTSILWTVVIGASLYTSVVLQRRPLEDRKALFAFVFGASLLFTLLPLSTNSYGPAGSWCWIKAGGNGTLWRYLCFYGPLWCAFFWNCFTYRKVVKAITAFAKMSKVTEQQHRLIKLANQLRWYPIILVIAWFFLTLMRILNSINPDRDNFPIAVVGVTTRGLYGAMNAAAYGMTPSVKAKWRQLFQSVRKSGCSSIFQFDPQHPDDFGSEAVDPEVQLATEDEASNPMN